MNDTYLSKGNAKTGDTWSFDLPAKETCPGMTTECGKDCYAARLMRLYPQVHEKYNRNWEFADSPDFVRYMTENIPASSIGRIHVSGDFYNAAYIRKWAKIAAARKDVRFYCYTRSWRKKQLLKALDVLGSLPNVTLNLSVDSETGKPDFPGAGFYRWCHLTSNDRAPRWVRKRDIIFRSNHTGRIGNHKWKRIKAEKMGLNPNDIAPLIHVIGKGTVCPKERGADIPITCATCLLCINKKGA